MPSSPPITVIFLGTSDFAVPSLRMLAADPRFSVLAVVTQPDKPVGRHRTLTAPPVKEEALTLGLSVHQPQSIRSDYASLGLPRPDMLVVVSYGQLLSQEILDLPRIAPVNVHASLLPRWRGASPIQHTILAGDTLSGVTVQRMVKELDAGPILGTHAMALDDRETYETLKARLAEAGASLLCETLSSPLRETPQQEADITTCRKLSRADGSIDPSRESAEDIDRKVRALNPWPGVTCSIDGQDVKLLETSLEKSPRSAPLACAEGTILSLVTVQPAGKKSMSGEAWNRGRR